MSLELSHLLILRDELEVVSRDATTGYYSIVFTVRIIELVHLILAYKKS